MNFDILDDQLNIVRTVIADLAFMQANYPGHFQLSAHQEPIVPPVVVDNGFTGNVRRRARTLADRGQHAEAIYLLLSKED